MNEPGRIGALLASPFWNRDERRLRALWRLVGFAVVAGVLSRIALAAGLVQRGHGGLVLFEVAMRLVLTMLPLWITARLLERRPLSDSGLRLDRAFPRELGMGLALGALLMSGIFGVEKALGWVGVKGVLHAADPARPFALAFLTPLIVFVCVGIYEEALFRGFLMRTLGEGFSSRFVPPRAALVLACVVSSALFGLGHRNNPEATAVSTLNIAVAGVFLALPYLLTTRLALSIGLHITWNLFQGSVYGFPVSGNTGLTTTIVAIEQRGPIVWTGGAFGPEAGLLGLVAMGAGSIAIFLCLRDAQGRAQVQEALAAPPVRPAPLPPAPPPAEPDQLPA